MTKDIESNPEEKILTAKEIGFITFMLLGYKELFYYTFGKGSHLNTIGKIVLSPVIIIFGTFMATIFYLLEYFFTEEPVIPSIPEE